MILSAATGDFEIYIWEVFAISIEASGQVPGEEGLLIAS